MKVPRLYAIADASFFNSTEELFTFCAELVSAGVMLIQYRNKRGNARVQLREMREMKRLFGSTVTLIGNDRADLCLAAGFDGVHVGQEDLSPEAVRKVIGSEKIVGVSTHNPEQLQEADGWPVDYIAVGPVFATTTKENPDPVIGLEGVRLARSLTSKPLVAIGGITRQNCRDVFTAGADSVAIVSDLLNAPCNAVRVVMSAGK